VPHDEKTRIFNAPNSNRTVILPRPGGGNRQPVMGSGMLSNNDHALSLSNTKSINPLITAAFTLLNLQVELRACVSHPDVASLQKKLVKEIKKFEHSALELHLTEDIIVTARYVLCCCVDEAVLNTPWGTQSDWVQQSLLSTFHKELFGGVKFFEILQKLQSRVSENIYLLELMYLCISLGFEGKFSVEANGKQLISDIREKLYRDLQQGRQKMGEELSPNWEKPANLENGKLMKLIPLWVVLSISLAFMAVVYTGFRIWLFSSTAPVVEQLNQVANPDSNPVKN